MVSSNNPYPLLPFTPPSPNGHRPSFEASAEASADASIVAKVVMNLDLASHLTTELSAQEPQDLRSRSVKLNEDQVVHYTKDQLIKKKSLCDRGSKVITERENRYFQTPSAKTLSHLLDQIQTTYLKYWELQRIVEILPERIPKSLLSVVDNLEQFENHIVDFFLRCTPSDPDQTQDLFLMILWFEGVKNTKQETESANFISISKRILSFFENDKIINIPITKINKRVTCCDPKNQKMELFDEDLLPEVVISGISNSLKHLSCFRDTETLKSNILKFIYGSELFKEKHCVQASMAKKLTVSALCESAFKMIHKLNSDNLALVHESHDIPDLTTDSLLFRALRFSDIGEMTYNSPDIGLSILERLINFLRVPEFKKKVFPVIQQCALLYIDKPIWTTICNFLITQDTSNLANIPNKDSRHYISAVFYYLKNEPEKSEAELLKSRTPEAQWLLSKLYEKNNQLEEAIKSSKLAIQQGVHAANLQQALLLIKNSKNNIVSIEEVIAALKRAITHYDFIDAKEVSFYIQGIIDQLELIEIKPRALETTSTRKKKSKKQRRLPNPTGENETTKIQSLNEAQSNSIVNRDLSEQKQNPDFSEDQCSEDQYSEDQCSINESITEEPIQGKILKSIHRTRLSYISLCVTQLLHNSDFEQARAILQQFCQDTQFIIQQASFAHMDLWSLRVMAKESEHLAAFNSSAKQEQKLCELNILSQSGETLIHYGLDRKDSERVLLSDDIPKNQLAIRNLLIDKALGWLCCLHPCDQDLADYKALWIRQPRATAKRQLAEFEHSLSLTFITGSFLSLIGHIHGDMATDCDDQKEKNRLKHKAGEFYNTANEFNKWRNRLKNEPCLRHRIAKITPLGDIQRLRRKLVVSGPTPGNGSVKNGMNHLPP
ncbi:lipopolysaccharide assembly protein LapB [Endozoicomonas sp. SCSIO W0465]|uniref:tetratricopeptide repeat protein n=1 Tax=Endozoicomonas sp. SCSIO W0465 TaxID=2918516 RepID=UPI002075C12A|nr:hypothetical protein [Endozoicomonas sp. SCSIO W0465]USE37954.1 hypothetical protein MJO57_07145 [Endozoicomonas sp. SCSIO W0465]